MCAALLSHQIHLIASNQPFFGDMRGIRGADYVCHSEARRAGLKGTYRAFLTSRDQDLSAIVVEPEDRRVPVVNSKVRLGDPCTCSMQS